MLCKYYLQLGTDTVDTSSADCIDVSAMINNLDAIKVSYKRVDLGGVVRKCGSSIEFTDKAYDAILEHYAENYLQSKGVFAVYIADNNWVYTKAWECPLDFATLQYDANILTIGCVDNSAAAIIKANKKSKYEFNVSSLKETYDLLYNGIVTKRQFGFMVTGVTPEGEETLDMVSSADVSVTRKGYYSLYIPQIDVNTSGFSSEKITCCSTSQETTWSVAASGKDDGVLMKSLMDADRAGFVECLQGCLVHIDMDMTFSFDYASWWSQRSMKAFFILVIGDTVVWRKEVTDYNSVDVNIHEDFNMSAGQKMAFGLSILSNRSTNNWMGVPLPDGTPNPNTYLIFNPGLRWGSNSHSAFVDESDFDDDPIDINVVKPIKLLQKLTDAMFEGHSFNGYVMCKIESGNSPLSRALLVAAESLRGISTNKIYSSFQDFCDFMEAVFGYVYTLEDVGYLMDEELRKIDDGERTTLSHIKMSYLTSQAWFPSNEGFFRMLPFGGVVSDDIESKLDTTTEFSASESVTRLFSNKIFYYDSENVFVYYDSTTDKYYVKFSNSNHNLQGSWYNDDTWHAREMIGVYLYLDYPNDRFGVIRNGMLFFVDGYRPQYWLDSNENNKPVTELTFKHRSVLFGEDTIKTLGHVNNLSYQIDDSMVFSDVEVGYTKQDYENGNSAINEYNFTNYYKSDSNINETTLSLHSPYRADCYGIEELLHKRTDDPTEQQKRDKESEESDNDVFIIIASAEVPDDVPNVGKRWKIDRSIEVHYAYTNTVFNAAIAPCIIVKNNEEYIGCFARSLKFTTSDGNSSAQIGGVGMSDNIDITKQLFKAGKISIDTDDHKFPTNWEGIIEFKYAGKTYKGYLDGIDICFANLGTITYNIIEKCIE